MIKHLLGQRQWLSILLLLCSLFFCCQFSQAAPLQSAEQAFKLSVNLSKEHAIQLQWKIANKAYLYQKFIKLTVNHPDDAKLGEIVFPKGEMDNNVIFGNIIIYRHHLSLTVPVASHSQPSVQLNLSYQGCTDAGHCFPPVSHVLNINFQQGTVAVDHHAVPTQSKSQQISQSFMQHNMLWIIGMFLFFGILLAFTPCVLPMIPILSGILLQGQKDRSKVSVFLLSLCYVLGMSLAYALLGLLISFVGQGVQAILQNPYVVLVFGLLFVVLSLPLFGLFEMRASASLNNKLMSISNALIGKGYLSIVVMGFLSALIVSPCVTPPLVGALAYIAASGHILLGMIALFSLGFGMGLPLIAICMVGKKVLPKAGQWMDVIKMLFGFLLLAVAVSLWQRIVADHIAMLLWGIWMIVVAIISFFAIKFNHYLARCLLRLFALLLVIYGLFLSIGGIKGSSDYFSPLSISSQSGQENNVTVHDMHKLNQLLAAAKRQHKPVVIDFSASWCLDCKSMAVSVFSHEKVKQAMQSFVWIKVDVSKNTAGELAIEKYYHVIGPPAFVFYAANGQQLSSLNFSGMTSAKEFVSILEKVMTSSPSQ